MNQHGHVGKQLTLLTRPGCHLCEVAKAVVQSVTGDTGAVLTEINVDENRELRAEYGDMVPVLLIDGVQHGYFQLDRERLRRALLS